MPGHGADQLGAAAGAASRVRRADAAGLGQAALARVLWGREIAAWRKGLTSLGGAA